MTEPPPEQITPDPDPEKEAGAENNEQLKQDPSSVDLPNPDDPQSEQYSDAEVAQKIKRRDSYRLAFLESTETEASTTSRQNSVVSDIYETNCDNVLEHSLTESDKAVDVPIKVEDVSSDGTLTPSTGSNNGAEINPIYESTNGNEAEPQDGNEAEDSAIYTDIEEKPLNKSPIKEQNAKEQKPVYKMGMVGENIMPTEPGKNVSVYSLEQPVPSKEQKNPKMSVGDRVKAFEMQKQNPIANTQNGTPKSNGIQIDHSKQSDENHPANETPQTDPFSESGVYDDVALPESSTELESNTVLANYLQNSGGDMYRLVYAGDEDLQRKLSKRSMNQHSYINQPISSKDDVHGVVYEDVPENGDEKAEEVFHENTDTGEAKPDMQGAAVVMRGQMVAHLEPGMELSGSGRYNHLWSQEREEKRSDDYGTLGEINDGEEPSNAGQVSTDHLYFDYDAAAPSSSDMADYRAVNFSSANYEEIPEQGSSSSQDDIYEPIAGAEDMNADSDSDGWGSEEFEEYSEGDISEGLGQASAESLYENVPPKNIKRKSVEGAQGPSVLDRLSRISFRSKKDRSQEDEDAHIIDVPVCSEKHPPPQLPPEPPGLTAEQIKRRHIVGAIIQSENSYVESLKRLVQDYEKPLRVNPHIMDIGRVRIIFNKIIEILQCHLMFQIELAEAVKNWDQDGRIGDVFTASFSKDMVFNAYSDFVNKFSVAMETAKQMAKHKQQFAEFLKARATASMDRLSLFGLMVKPIQRFPQFILFLQDLLKHTPKEHPDRMALQRALTELENLTHRLNERKRASEQKRDVKEIISHMNVKILRKGVQEGNRFLIRQDDLKQVEYGPQGGISKTKTRRLFILNDLLMCTTVIQRPCRWSFEAVDRETETGMIERYNLKWFVPVADVEMIDTAITPSMQVNIKGEGARTVISSIKPESSDGLAHLRRDLENLLHDFAVMAQISNLKSSLRLEYETLSDENLESIKRDLQKKIRVKDEQLRLYDSCTVQLSFPEKTGRVKYTFQLDNPEGKQEWELDFKMTQLALDPSNNPAWTFPETEKGVGYMKMPLFMRALPIDITKQYTKVDCAIPVFLQSSDSSGFGIQHLWSCSSTNNMSQVTLVAIHTSKPRVVESFKACDCRIMCVEFVPLNSGFDIDNEIVWAEDTVWMGTCNRSIIIHKVQDSSRKHPVTSVSTQSNVISLKYIDNKVFAALESGAVAIYTRTLDTVWKLNEPRLSQLGDTPVTCLLQVDDHMWCSCGNKIHIINPKTELKEKRLTVEHKGIIKCMVQSGVGFWITFQNESLIRLYHVESFSHLQDINIASTVSRTVTMKDRSLEKSDESPTFITCLLASRGTLWIGTNKGVTLSLPLPRLQGVPLISRAPCVSVHAHNGPVRFLVSVCSEMAVMPSNRVEGTLEQSGHSDISAASQHSDNTRKQVLKNTSIDLSIENGSENGYTRSDSVQLRRGPGVMPSGLASARSKWQSTPILFSRTDSEDNIRLLYDSLLKGTETDYDTDVLALKRTNTPAEHGNYLSLRANSRDVQNYKRSMKISIPSSGEGRRFKAKSLATVLDRSKSYEVNPKIGSVESTRSFDFTQSVGFVRRRNSSQDSIEEMCELEEEQEQGVPCHNAPRYLHNSPCKSLIVVSGGDGYSNWQKASPKDLRNDDARLIMWQCKVT